MLLASCAGPASPSSDAPKASTASEPGAAEASAASGPVTPPDNAPAQSEPTGSYGFLFEMPELAALLEGAELSTQEEHWIGYRRPVTHCSTTIVETELAGLSEPFDELLSSQGFSMKEDTWTRPQDEAKIDIWPRKSGASFLLEACFPHEGSEAEPPPQLLALAHAHPDAALAMRLVEEFDLLLTTAALMWHRENGLEVTISGLTPSDGFAALEARLIAEGLWTKEASKEWVSEQSEGRTTLTMLNAEEWLIQVQTAKGARPWP